MNTGNPYGLTGKFRTQPGKRDEMISLLLQGSEDMKGCQLYVVSKDSHDENVIWVFEVWDTKEDHDNSLKEEGVKEIIARAMPLIDGKPDGAELEIMGGKLK